MAWIFYVSAILWSFWIGNSHANAPIFGVVAMGIGIFCFMILTCRVPCRSDGIAIIFSVHFLMASYSFLRFDLALPAAKNTSFTDLLGYIMITPILILGVLAVVVVYFFFVASEIDDRRVGSGMPSVIRCIFSPRFLFNVIAGALSGLAYLPAF